MLDKISVTILTKNSQYHLTKCLDALTIFNDVVILDNGSTDNTIELAKSYPNVTVVEHEFIGFGPLKNLVIESCKHDWILSVDVDEVISAELLKQISKLSPEQNTVYSVSRHNHYNGLFVKACGWYPNYLVRLFNRKHTQFNDVQVHESVVVKASSRVIKLKAPLLHYTYSTASEIVEKMQHYSSLYAQEWVGKKQSSLFKAVFKLIYIFIRDYFFRRGIFYGYVGFLIALSQANGNFYKYIKLLEANKLKENK